MNDFDVIVIGGGPAGCYAALAASIKGLRVAVFEEHKEIGLPRHDPGWLMESEFAESIISILGNTVPWSRVKEYRLCNAESGDLIEKSTSGGYLIRRDFLEKEIAALAIKAGAKLYLKTKVVTLVRNGEKVEGIKTNSAVIPEATANIFICADGIRSSDNGFALKEGLCERGEIRAGISYLLANAAVQDGIVEVFLSSDPILNYRGLFTHREDACFFSVPSYAAFQELKERLDNVISSKIKYAYPLEISGYGLSHSGKYGKYFAKIIKGNMIFVGDASGGSGCIHGMIQGKFAGKVAYSAITENNLSEQRLSEYQDSVFSTLGKAPFFYFSAREDFGSFHNWFRQFAESTKGIKATELDHLV